MNNRLPSLDGLRAISILMVIYWHLIGTPEFQDMDFMYLNCLISGDLGVHIFFVISGFLITSLLLQGEIKERKINLREFYLRRVFRIFPAYYFYMITVIILDKFVVSDLDIKSIVEPLSYTTGLWASPHNTGWTVSHSWSLSVEEQYYLLYPFFLVIVGKVFSRRFILWALILTIPVIRVIIYKYYAPALMDSIFYRGDCILWGCLLSFYVKEIRALFSKHTTLLNSFLVLIFSVNVLLKFLSYHFLAGFLTIPFTYTAQAIFACLLIVRFVVLPDEINWIFKFLNNSLLVFIGMLSYSIYLWQEFVLQPVESPYIWKAFPYNIISIFVLAFLSYNLIERPFLKLRKKLVE